MEQVFYRQVMQLARSDYHPSIENPKSRQVN